jgi:hypothetical protein
MSDELGGGEWGTNPRSCLEEPKKITKTSIMIVGVPVEIRTKHLPSKRLECYRYANLS